MNNNDDTTPAKDDPLLKDLEALGRQVRQARFMGVAWTPPHTARRPRWLILPAVAAVAACIVLAIMLGRGWLEPAGPPQTTPPQPGLSSAAQSQNNAVEYDLLVLELLADRPAVDWASYIPADGELDMSQPTTAKTGGAI